MEAVKRNLVVRTWLSSGPDQDEIKETLWLAGVSYARGLSLLDELMRCARFYRVCDCAWRWHWPGKEPASHAEALQEWLEAGGIVSKPMIHRLEGTQIPDACAEPIVEGRSIVRNDGAGSVLFWPVAARHRTVAVVEIPYGPSQHDPAAIEHALDLYTPYLSREFDEEDRDTRRRLVVDAVAKAGDPMRPETLVGLLWDLWDKIEPTFWVYGEVWRGGSLNEDQRPTAIYLDTENTVQRISLDPPDPPVWQAPPRGEQLGETHSTSTESAAKLLRVPANARLHELLRRGITRLRENRLDLRLSEDGELRLRVLTLAPDNMGSLAADLVELWQQIRSAMELRRQERAGQVTLTTALRVLKLESTQAAIGAAVKSFDRLDLHAVRDPLDRTLQSNQPLSVFGSKTLRQYIQEALGRDILPQLTAAARTARVVSQLATRALERLQGSLDITAAPTPLGEVVCRAFALAAALLQLQTEEDVWFALKWNDRDDLRPMVEDLYQASISAKRRADEPSRIATADLFDFNRRLSFAQSEPGSVDNPVVLALALTEAFLLAMQQAKDARVELDTTLVEGQGIPEIEIRVSGEPPDDFASRLDAVKAIIATHWPQFQTDFRRYRDRLVIEVRSPGEKIKDGLLTEILTYQCRGSLLKKATGERRGMLVQHKTESGRPDENRWKALTNRLRYSMSYWDPGIKTWGQRPVNLAEMIDQQLGDGRDDYNSSLLDLYNIWSDESITPGLAWMATLPHQKKQWNLDATRCWRTAQWCDGVTVRIPARSRPNVFVYRVRSPRSRCRASRTSG